MPRSQPAGAWLQAGQVLNRGRRRGADWMQEQPVVLPPAPPPRRLDQTSSANLAWKRLNSHAAATFLPWVKKISSGLMPPVRHTSSTNVEFAFVLTAQANSSKIYGRGPSGLLLFRPGARQGAPRAGSSRAVQPRALTGLLRGGRGRLKSKGPCSSRKRSPVGGTGQQPPPAPNSAGLWIAVGYRCPWGRKWGSGRGSGMLLDVPTGVGSRDNGTRQEGGQRWSRSRRYRDLQPA